MVITSTHINNLSGVLTTLSHGVLTPSTFSKLLCEIVSAVAAGDADPTHEPKSDKAVVIECLRSMAHTLPSQEKELIGFMIDSCGPLIDRLLDVNAARLEKIIQSQAAELKTGDNLPVSAGGRRYGLIKQTPDERDFEFILPNKESYPETVDLRITGFVPPALDQGSAGTCSAHAAASALRYLIRKEKLQDFQPSRLFIYFTSRVYVEGISPSEDSGCTLRDVVKALSTYHVCNERYFPYNETKIAEQPPALAVANARLHTTFTYHAVQQSLSALKGALATGYPVIIGIQVFDSFESEEVAQTGALQMPADREQCLGGHACLLVAYSDSNQTFTLLNSFGTSWGQEGYFTLPYDYLTNPELAFDFWMITGFK